MPSNDRLKVYMNDPTEGLQDGDLVSKGTGLAPIAPSPLLANDAEMSSAIKLAVRCDEGYETVEDEGRHVEISIEDSTHINKWRLALTAEGLEAAEWGDPLEITTLVDDTNTIFYAQARALDTEGPTRDGSVNIKALGLVGVE